MEKNTFGRVSTAMVTPMKDDLELDRVAVKKVAERLTRPGFNDTLVINGTTGESATTSDAEKFETLEIVVEAVGDRVSVIAGVGSADTRHSIKLAKDAKAAGANGLLLVTPYYSKPTQQGILEHFFAVADSTDLPVMLYDIPGRSGVGLVHETIVSAAEHPNITALKDAKGDMEAASWVVRDTDLALYSGEDALNLPMLSIGATGFVSVAGHFVANKLREMLEAYERGDILGANTIHAELLPLYKTIFLNPGAVSSKAGLAAEGLISDAVRAPYHRLHPTNLGPLASVLQAL